MSPPHPPVALAPRLHLNMVELDGGWTWQPFWDEHHALIAKYNELAQRWSKYLPVINGRTQPVGRPLAAREAQQAMVRKLRKAHRSLRWIAARFAELLGGR